MPKLDQLIASTCRQNFLMFLGRDQFSILLVNQSKLLLPHNCWYSWIAQLMPHFTALSFSKTELLSTLWVHCAFTNFGFRQLYWFSEKTVILWSCVTGNMFQEAWLDHKWELAIPTIGHVTYCMNVYIATFITLYFNILLGRNKK